VKAADDFAAAVGPTIRQMRDNAASLRAITAEMAAKGIPPRAMGNGPRRRFATHWPGQWPKRRTPIGGKMNAIGDRCPEATSRCSSS
jgi:hypothetical protein